MTPLAFDRTARRAAERAREAAAADLTRLISDAGVTPAELARTSHVDAAYVARILAGRAAPSTTTYARLATALGADLSVRLYPNTGPNIRDRHQAGMLEALLGVAHARWRPFTEIAVRRPARGWIDAGLHDARAGVLVATEIQSELRRLELLIRWAGEKAESLPSWDGWTHLGSPEVSRLLVIRDTRTTRAVATEHRRQLRAAYPADPRDALEAITSSATWPGPSIVWASGRGTASDPWRLVARP